MSAVVTAFRSCTRGIAYPSIPVYINTHETRLKGCELRRDRYAYVTGTFPVVYMCVA